MSGGGWQLVGNGITPAWWSFEKATASCMKPWKESNNGVEHSSPHPSPNGLLDCCIELDHVFI